MVVVLPPPPGFVRRSKPKGNGGRRYFYPFSEGERAEAASLMHDAYVEFNKRRWRRSRLYRMALKIGKVELERRYELLRKGRAYGGVTAQEEFQTRTRLNRAARSVGMFMMSRQHPLFDRRDPLSQILEHLFARNRYFMKLDIENAFGAVTPKLWQKAEARQFWPVLEEFAGGWPFFHPEDGGLIQGAPASPLIFNEYCRVSGFDNMLRTWAKEHGCVVSRYMDDVVISRPEKFGGRSLRSMKKRFAGYGFSLNAEKSGLFDTAKKPLTVLGTSYRLGKVRPGAVYLEKLDRQPGGPTPAQLLWLALIEEQNRTSREYRHGITVLQ